MHLTETNIRKFFLGLFAFGVILQLILTIVFISLPKETQAQASLSSSDYCNQVSEEEGIRMGVYIPGVTHVITTKEGKKIYVVKDLACYLANFYKYFAGAIAIISTVMIIFGGFKYVTSFGNPTRIAGAKDTITSAVVALVITLGTFIFLYTINPRIVTLSLPGLTEIKSAGRMVFWCSDLEPVEVGPRVTSSCGTFDKELECYWDSCPPDEICYLTKDGKFECQDPKTVCEKADKKECDSVDARLARMGIKDKSCRLWRYGVDHCEYHDILKCPDGYDRIPCDSKAGADSECWKDGAPKDCDYRWYNPVSKEKYCTDDERANKKADGICCGKSNKDQIDCRDEGNDDEREVDCGKYNNQKDTTFESGGIIDGTCKDVDGDGLADIRCWCNEKCWQEMECKYEKF